MKSILKEHSSSMLQFIKFGIVGVSNTLLSYVIYIFFLYLLQRTKIEGETTYLCSNIIAFIISVAWSYYWNNRFVFNDEKDISWIKILLKTYVAYSFTGLFLSSVLLIVWVQYLGISEYIAPIINLLFTVPINFIINKFWAFASKKKG